jgi:LysE type translocator
MGLSVAAPFGPVSLVCFSRAIRQGIGFGVVGGLGAATAHGFFAAVAYLGASAIIVLVGDIRSGLRLISATILILIGVRIICRRSCSAARPASDGVSAVTTTASGHAEGEAALALIEPHVMAPQPVTLGADNGPFGVTDNSGGHGRPLPSASAFDCRPSLHFAILTKSQHVP